MGFKISQKNFLENLRLQTKFEKEYDPEYEGR